MKTNLSLKNLSDRQRWVLAGAFLCIILVWSLLIRALETSPVDSFLRCVDAGNPVTDSNPPTCTDGKQYYVGPYASPDASSEPMKSLQFQILVDGDSGGNFPRSTELINDQTSWIEYWGWVHNSRSVLPPLLPIDFATSSVIAVSEGKQQTSGYVFKITGVSTGKRGTVIDIRESIPTVTCRVSVIPTNRYFIVRTEKVKEPISFRYSTEKRKCS